MRAVLTALTFELMQNYNKVSVEDAMSNKTQFYVDIVTIG
jgi:hypothetical protein